MSMPVVIMFQSQLLLTQQGSVITMPGVCPGQHQARLFVSLDLYLEATQRIYYTYNALGSYLCKNIKAVTILNYPSESNLFSYILYTH